MAGCFVSGWVLPLFFVSIIVQSLSCVRLFRTPWTAAHQASPSFPVSIITPIFLSIRPMDVLILLCWTLPPSPFFLFFGEGQRISHQKQWGLEGSGTFFTSQKKKKMSTFEFYYQVNWSFRNEGEIKTSSEKGRLEESVTQIPHKNNKGSYWNRKKNDRRKCWTSKKKQRWKNYGIWGGVWKTGNSVTVKKVIWRMKHCSKHWHSRFPWLKLCTFTAEGISSIPGQGSSLCCMVQPKKKKSLIKRKTLPF